MDKNFSPADIESRWYEQWESAGYFTPSGEGPAYCIPIPPPNVTGTLHMGHGFQQAIMDALMAFEGPVIEVHVSNIHKREKFRHQSYVSLRADGVIAGLGVSGYEFAVMKILEILKNKNPAG